jgi:hypothetical protein
MSFALTNTALAMPLPPARRAVLLALSDMANAAGVCWPSIATIARRACMSARSVFTHLKELVRAGLVQRRQRIGRSNLFTLTLEPLSDGPAPLPEQATNAPAPELAPTPQPAQKSAPAPTIAPVVLTVGSVVQAMRHAGMLGAYECTPLAALVASASDMAEFTEAATAASKKGMGFAWALARVEGRRKDASSPPVHADVARCTVPSKPGRDLILIELEQQASLATPPPASIRERLARLKAEIVGAVNQQKE